MATATVQIDGIDESTEHIADALDSALTMALRDLNRQRYIDVIGELESRCRTAREAAEQDEEQEREASR